MLLVKTWHFNLLVYWVIVAVSQAAEYYRKFRQHELSALELGKTAGPSQTCRKRYRMQLNPHFARTVPLMRSRR